MRSLFAAAFVAISMPSSGFAHPHVFIDAKAAMHVDEEGRLGGLRITWVYDAFTSLTLLALLELEEERDGGLSESVLARVVQAQTVWPEDFNGDTYLESAGKPVALGRPVNGAAEMNDGRIAVSFDLPLQEPLGAGEAAELRLYDPTYYYAYSAVDVGASEFCETSLTRFEADDATSDLKAKLSLLSREETPEQDGVGRLFADVISLRCSGN